MTAFHMISRIGRCSAREMFFRGAMACLAWMIFAPAAQAQLTLLTYNIHGNGVAGTNWTTNAPQIQALGRELIYLNPDIVTFNEIPYGGTTNMTNIIATYLPGFHLVISPKGDGFIHNGIASRYPILTSASFLNNTSLTPFGSSNTFTRDLYEAEIQVPNYPQPLDVFTVHLKATTTTPTNDAVRRAAEAGAVSNFLVNTYLKTNGGRLYTLSGDMNEDIFRPETNMYVSGHPIQKLVSPSPTGLQLTTPVNPQTPPTNNDLTESIQGPLDVRFDYILPCGALYSNISGSQVFRTDLLAPTPPGLEALDDKTCSDHLPVIMTFNNPADVPYQLTAISVTNQTLTLAWQSIAGRQYRVDVSSDLSAWAPFATNLIATDTNFTLVTNVSADVQYFRIFRLP